MWFKSMRVYHLETPFKYSPDELNELISKQKFQPCQGQDLVRFGWTDVMGNKTQEPMLVHKIGNDYFFRCLFEKKMLPSSVVNEMLADRIDEIQSTQARTVRKKERDDIKADLITELLPKAFPIHKEVWLWINAQYGYVAVNSTSGKVCDDILALLRKGLNSFPAKPIAVNNDISTCLTDWLSKDDAPDGVIIGDETELKSENGIIRAKKQDLSSDEIKTHLDAGKMVTSLALSLNEEISFIIDSDFNFKRIRLSDTVLEENVTGSDDPAVQIDADLALMSGEYCKMIPAMIAAFGGLMLPAEG